MNALELDSSKEVQTIEPDAGINGKVVAKALLVALLIAGLATATFFSFGATLSLIGAGAAGWQIGLVIVGFLASAVSLLGSGYFAAKHHMFEDTGDNLSDAGKFVRDTFGTGFHVAAAGINAVREWQIWDMITSR